ncbi:MAG: CatA-like O-acetyltransferase [Clostridiales bacterium]|nr:CatA-like O-acetyltransferase [Clostridiales bacterium]
MKTIDETTWPRRAHCELFGRSANPIYSVTFPLDVTGLYGYVKREGLSFYHAMIWAVMRAINGVEAFHYKLRPDGLIWHDVLSPSYTFPWGEDLFAILNLDFDPSESLHAFCARAAREQQALRDPLPTEEEDAARDDLVYLSCLPWFTYYHITQETTGDRNDSVPRLLWGRFEEQNGRLVLPMTVQVNHRLIDGIHLSWLKSALEREMKEWRVES